MPTTARSTPVDAGRVVVCGCEPAVAVIVVCDGPGATSMTGCGTFGTSTCVMGGKGGGGVRGNSFGSTRTSIGGVGRNLVMWPTRPCVKSQKPTNCRPMARPTSGAREKGECRV